MHAPRLCVPALVAAMLVSAPLYAQTQPPLPPIPGANPGGEPLDYQKLLAEYDAAQAAAARPGDQRMSCDALHEEATANMKDPALQAYIARTGAAAQRDLAKMQAGQASMAAQNAASAAAALTPGGAAAIAAAQRARDAEQRVEAKQRVQQENQQAAELSALMPKLMRSQRLYELAEAKGCKWMEEGGFGGAAPFGDFEEAAPTP